MQKKYVDYVPIVNAVCVKIDRKKYILYIKQKTKSWNKVSFTNSLYIVSYSNYRNEEDKHLLDFQENVNVEISYDGKYIYFLEYEHSIYSNGKITKYEIIKTNDTFSLVKKEEITSDKNRKYKGVVLSDSFSIAMYEEFTRNVYEIVNGNLRFLTHCKKMKVDNMCYIGNKLEFNKSFGSSTTDALKKYNFVVDTSFPKKVLMLNDTQEIIYVTTNSLIFESNGEYSGIIFFDDKRISHVLSNLSGGIIVIVDEKILIINKSDIKRLKERSSKELTKIRKNMGEVIKLIGICSGCEKDVFFNFSIEFEKRGHHMLKDMQILYKAAFCGNIAWKMYKTLQK